MFIEYVNRECNAIGCVRPCPSVCVCLFPLQLTLDLDVFARIWVMTVARRRLKVNVKTDVA